METTLQFKEQAEAWTVETKQRCLEEGETVLATLLAGFKGKTDDPNDVFQEAVLICKPFIGFDADILSTPKVAKVLKARMNELIETKSKLVASLASVVDHPWASIMKEASEYTNEYAYPIQSSMCRFFDCMKYYSSDTTFETAEAKKFMDRLADHDHVADIADGWVWSILQGVAHQLDYKYKTSECFKVRSLHWEYKSPKRKTPEATSASKRASVGVGS